MLVAGIRPIFLIGDSLNNCIKKSSPDNGDDFYFIRGLK